MSAGIRSTNLKRLSAVDELLGNQTAGGVEATGVVTIAALSDQVAASGPIQAIADRVEDVAALASAGARGPKAAVRLLVETNVNIATDCEAGDTFDGVVLVAGNRIAKAYNGATGHATNGVYVVQASGAAVRATDMDAAAELPGTYFQIDAGTYAGQTWALATAAPITVGTTALSFIKSASVAPVTAEVVAARAAAPTLGGRLDGIDGQAAADRALALNSLYSTATSTIAEDHDWGMLPVKSFPATPGLLPPSWMTFSRASGATFVGADGLLRLAANDEMRHDFDPDTGKYLGVLFEGAAATNTALYSEDLTNVLHVKLGVTIQANASVAPDGTGTADRLVEDSSSGAHQTQQTVAAVAADENTFSFFVRNGGRKVRPRVFSLPDTTINVGVTFDPATGTFSGATALGGATHRYSAKQYRDGYWRVSYSYKLGGPDVSVLQRVSLTNSAGVANYVGDGVSYADIWGWQNEAGEVATSYVKTTSAAATRARDIMNAAVSGLAAGGALFFRGRRTYIPTELQTLAALDDGTVNDSIYLRTSMANIAGLVVTDGGVQQASIFETGGGKILPADADFIAMATWAPDDFAMSVNGRAAVTDNAGTVPTLTTMRVGGRSVSGQGYIGHVLHVAVFGQQPALSALQRIASLQVGSGEVVSGKVGVFYGDSISEFIDYPTRVANLLGMTAVNVGFGGCRMSRTAGGDYDQLSMVVLAEAARTGDYSAVIAAVAALALAGDDNTAILGRLMAVDWSAVTHVIIFYGTNDYGGNAPLGTASDIVETTFRGAINLTVSRLLTAYPHLKILFATPIFRARLASGDGKDADHFPNSGGVFLSQYVDAEIDQAGRNKCPSYDMFRRSGINMTNHATFLYDGLHANTDVGSQRIADKIAAFITAEG